MVNATTCKDKVAAINAILANMSKHTPELPACQGWLHDFCSQTDPSTWCCNLGIGCVCALDGTQQDIERYCSGQQNGGISCGNCPAAPQCKGDAVDVART